MTVGFSFTKAYWSPNKFYGALENHAEKERLAVLDVGCGRRKFRGSTGLDERGNSLADINHDLNVFPYPLQDDSYDIVLCRHVLEHLDNIPAALEEFYRVARPGGMVTYTTS